MWTQRYLWNDLTFSSRLGVALRKGRYLTKDRYRSKSSTLSRRKRNTKRGKKNDWYKDSVELVRGLYLPAELPHFSQEGETAADAGDNTKTFRIMVFVKR